MSDLNNYLPFPEDVKTHPLLVVDYALIKQRNPAEVDKLWEAATTLGFWYLKNHGADAEVNGMFEMGTETMDLPLEEKMKFEQGDSGKSFGYKAAGMNAVDETGLQDMVEFMNVSKDDALAFPEPAHRAYPSTVVERMKPTIIPFVERSLEVNNIVLEIFNERLGLPEGELSKLHARMDFSGSEARVIKKAAAPEMSPERQALGAHTDFGSLSFLHNRLGGLQVYPPGAEGWSYIKPIPGHAICNVGDALSIFSGGILRSNMHRIVNPPKDQAAHTRWSVVFFTRPSNDVLLRALADKSTVIAGAVAASSDASRFNTGQTSSQWYARRMMNQRIKNRTGPETWRASRGTEHVDDTVGMGQEAARVVSVGA